MIGFNYTSLVYYHVNGQYGPFFELSVFELDLVILWDGSLFLTTLPTGVHSYDNSNIKKKKKIRIINKYYFIKI